MKRQCHATIAMLKCYELRQICNIFITTYSNDIFSHVYSCTPSKQKDLKEHGYARIKIYVSYKYISII